MTDRFDLTPLKEEGKKKAVREALTQIQTTEVGKDVLGSLSLEQKIRICEVLPEERHNSTTPDHTIHLIFNKKKDGFEVSTPLLLHEMVHERQHQNGLQTRQIGRFEDVVLHELLGECEAKAYEMTYKKAGGKRQLFQSLAFSMLNPKIGVDGNIPDVALLLSVYGGLPLSSAKGNKILTSYDESQLNEHLETRFYLGKTQEQTEGKVLSYYGKSLGLSDELMTALKNWAVKSIADQSVNKESCPKSLCGQLLDPEEKEEKSPLFPIVFKGVREERLIFVSEDDKGRLTFYDKDKKKLASDEKGHHFKDEKGNVVCSLVTDEKGDKSAIIYGSDGKKMIEWGKTPFGVESKHIIGERVRFAGKDDEYDVELQINAKGMHYRRDGEIKTISRDAVYGSEETFKILANTLKKIKGRS